MKAEELRIGNWVVNSKTIVTEIVSSKRGNEIGLNDGFVYNEIKVEPIQLTEEWLLKFGFEVVGKKTFYKGCISVIPDRKMFRCKGVWIQHVHQLQNLYFALTGKELSYED